MGLSPTTTVGLQFPGWEIKPSATTVLLTILPPLSQTLNSLFGPFRAAAACPAPHRPWSWVPLERPEPIPTSNRCGSLGSLRAVNDSRVLKLMFGERMRERKTA